MEQNNSIRISELSDGDITQSLLSLDSSARATNVDVLPRDQEIRCQRLHVYPRGFLGYVFAKKLLDCSRLMDQKPQDPQAKDDEGKGNGECPVHPNLS